MAPAPDVASFLKVFRNRPGVKDEPSWLTARREAAMKRFVELGFPTRKDENWRFTDVTQLVDAPVIPAFGESDVAADRLAPHYFGGPTHRLVFISGTFSPAYSSIGVLPDGVFLGSAAEAVAAQPALIEAAFDASETTGVQPFASLNAAVFADGFVLALASGVVLETPIEIIHYGDAPGARAFHLRNVVRAGAGSQATIIETTTGSSSGWTNMVTAMDIGTGAAIRHVKIQDEPPDVIHLSLTRSTLAKAARYETFILSLGARLSRQDIHIAAAGEAASTAIHGAYLLRGDQEATFAPFVDHQAPGCQTTEILKGIMEDNAHGVFLGKMAVRPGADSTNAHQLNQNLLLSPTTRVDTKPELEICTDEVKCSHGATVGELDETALFYLQARGIKEAAARHMLMEAFAADVIEKAELGEDLSGHLLGRLKGWLNRARGDL